MVVFGVRIPAPNCGFVVLNKKGFVMGKKKQEKETKKIVILGVGPEHRAVYAEELKGCKISFPFSFNAALAVARTADLIAVNIDHYCEFFAKAFERGYAGKVVAIATSRKCMNKTVELPNGKKITPVCCRTAPGEIMRLLSA